MTKKTFDDFKKYSADFEKEVEKLGERLENSLGQMQERTWRLKFLNKAAEIARWNKETFPDAEASGQVLKLSEEFDEMRDAIEEGDYLMSEKADCFIVAAALKERFNNALGRFVLDYLIEEMTDESEEKAAGYMEAIEKKMEINRARVWNKMPDGRFKHSD